MAEQDTTPHMNGTWHSENNSIVGKWYMANTPDVVGDFSFSPQSAPERSPDAICDTCAGALLSHERHVTCWSCFNVCHSRCHNTNTSTGIGSSGGGGNFICKRCQQVQAKYLHCPPVHRNWQGHFVLKTAEGRRNKVSDSFTLKFEFGKQTDSKAIAACSGTGQNTFGYFLVAGNLYSRAPASGYDVRFTKTYSVAPAAANSLGVAAASSPAAGPRQAAQVSRPNSPPSPSVKTGRGSTDTSPSPPRQQQQTQQQPQPVLHRTTKLVNIPKLPDEDNSKRRRGPSKSGPDLHSPQLVPIAAATATMGSSVPAIPAAVAKPLPPALTLVTYLEVENPVPMVWILNHFRQCRTWERFLCLPSASSNLPVASILAAAGNVDFLADLGARAAVSAACTTMDHVADEAGSASLGMSIVPCGSKYNIELICAAYAATLWPKKTIGVLQVYSSSMPPALLVSNATPVPRVLCQALIDSKVTSEVVHKSVSALYSCDVLVLSIQTEGEFASTLVTEALLNLGKPMLVLTQEVSESTLQFHLGIIAQMQRSMLQHRLPKSPTSVTAAAASASKSMATVLDVKLPMPPLPSVKPPISRSASFSSQQQPPHATPMFVPPAQQQQHHHHPVQQPAIPTTASGLLPSPEFPIASSKGLAPPAQQQQPQQPPAPLARASTAPPIQSQARAVAQVYPNVPPATQQQQQQQPVHFQSSAPNSLPQPKPQLSQAWQNLPGSSNYPRSSASFSGAPSSAPVLPQPISSSSLPQPLASTSSLPQPLSSKATTTLPQQQQQQQQASMRQSAIPPPQTMPKPQPSVSAIPPPQQQQQPPSNPAAPLFSPKPVLPQPIQQAAPVERLPQPAQPQRPVQPTQTTTAAVATAAAANASKRPRTMTHDLLEAAPAATFPAAPPILPSTTADNPIYISDSPPPPPSIVSAPAPAPAAATVPPPAPPAASKPKKEADDWDDDDDEDDGEDKSGVPDYSHLIS